MGDLLLLPFRRPFDSFSERIHPIYLVSAAFIVICVVLVRRSPNSIQALKRFFSKNVLFHKSSLLDYRYYYINTLVGVFWLFPLTAFFAIGFQEVSHAMLASLHIAPVFQCQAWLACLAYTLIIVTATDFGLFFSHWLQHKVPWLWEFHKVHHSAETLNPVTVYRMHPVDDFVGILFLVFFSVLADGLVRALYAGPIAEIKLLQLNLFTVLFYFAGYNLRHSTIWLDYGRFWDRVFVSPAQHQIHHSLDKRHVDKNMGFLFSFWDGLFGTLYVPQEEETLEYGIYDDHKFTGILQMYLLPFTRLGKHIKGRPVVQNLGLLVLLPFLLTPMIAAAMDKASQTVTIGDLTWPEVKELVNQGYTRVLVPSGGTEQGGPHLVLGKHNFVVQREAESIATDLGHTLIAPVIPFSPCGITDPPDAHMKFAGSITVRESTYRELLTDVARSLHCHGFKRIYLLADHGGSLDSEDSVARTLSLEWAKEGTSVVSLHDYYLNNGQTLALQASGFNLAKVGTHAGIRDTSELMAVNPEGVRTDRRIEDYGGCMGEPGKTIQLPTGQCSKGSGVDGDPTQATAEIGKDMLALKVRAAVQEILVNEKMHPLK